MEPTVELISHTPDPEKLMAHIARVSNPKNQDNPETSRLLGYLIRNKHWSPFETASMTVEITTTLDVATQILRHRSFCFQQLSRRYAGPDEAPVRTVIPKLRAPHPKNRQDSTDTLDPTVVKHYQTEIDRIYLECEDLYSQMVADGVAKECARAILPQGTETTLYMTGSARSFIHYIALRSAHGTQAEHKDVARQVGAVFKRVFPDTAKALESLKWEV